jgi:general secretion pathway protein A
VYEQFFELSEKPFSLNPDPSYLYLGRNHSRALTILEYGIASESGITVITGEIGAGKTTLVRHLLNEMDNDCVIGLISNTHKSFGELIHWISMAFGLKHEGKDKVALYNQFVEYMIDQYAHGRRVVLIVDEAQNLDAEALEELRVVSNINADKDLVIQLVLVGQPELRETLSRPDLKQFTQRISAYFHLQSLSREETGEYVKHRLGVAGVAREIFDAEALDLVFENSEGVPRLINTLCHLALTYAFADGSKTVTADVLRHVLEDRDTHGLFGAGITGSGDERAPGGRGANGDGGEPDYESVAATDVRRSAGPIK